MDLSDKPCVPDGVEVLSISALTSKVRAVLERTFDEFWVEGEISNLARPRSGHVYLTLKDAGSQLKSVMYRGIALRVRFEPKDGMEVIARGKMTVYQPRGEYQFQILELQPKGIGALELALQQLKEKLFRRGYFDPKRKRPLPRYPARIGVVTSPTGAAVRDVLEILGRRWPLAEVVVRGVQVQGDGAAEQIAAGIRSLNRLHGSGRLRFDLMIVGRGGGSIEDLWAFNEEAVADAIFASKIPVVSAVGHEIDTTIADGVADVRAATPSHAAELATPDRHEVLGDLARVRSRLPEALRRRVRLARERLDQLAQRRALRMPLERIRDEERRLDEISERLRRAMGRALDRQRDRLAALSGRLGTLSPLNVLARGYTLTRSADSDTLIRSVSQVSPGDVLVTRTPDGEVISRVEGFTKTSGTEGES